LVSADAGNLRSPHLDLGLAAERIKQLAVENAELEQEAERLAQQIKQSVGTE